MNILILDTETNGKARNFKAPFTDLDNWPRIIQLAYQICSPDGAILFEVNELTKPDGWEIPVEKFWIDNGFSTEQNEKNGHRLDVLLTSLVSTIEYFDVDTIVCHNIDFDKNVLAAEMLRYGVKAQRTLKKVCTMQSSTELCDIPGPYGLKWPKLQELHHFLFEEEFDDAHDAMADVNACRKCYFELKKRGVL